MLHKVSETCGDNETQKQILKDLEAQITAQQNEWQLQKQTLGMETQSFKGRTTDNGNF